MNKLEMLIGNNSQILFEKSIQKIGPFLQDYTKENIIIVPDRLSLITEQKIFEMLNINVYFNLSVMGISKFVNNVIKQSGLNIIECSNFQSKLLTLKAIQAVKNNFKCFSNNPTMGFVDEIYAKIEQIKSSNINITDLVDESASTGTKLKYLDLQLIYNEYEKLRGNKIDSGSLLALFNSMPTKTNENTNVFFIGFDSLTKQGAQVLCKVAKTFNYCAVSIPAPKKQNNFKIYDSSFIDLVTNMCITNNINYYKIDLDCTIQNIDKRLIQENIFSRKNKFTSCDYFNIYFSTSQNEELDFVVKSINYNLKNNNYKFKDIAVCTNLENMLLLKSKLSALGIDVYTDEKTPLSSTEPIKYISCLLKCAKEPNNKKFLTEYIYNSFCPLSKDQKPIVLNLLNQFSSFYGIKKHCVNVDECILKFINDFEAKISNLQSNKNYIQNILYLINDDEFTKKLNYFINLFKEKGEISLEKQYLQILDKLNKLLEDITFFIENDALAYKDFCEIFFKALDEYEISGVPSTVNQVFIGDVKSFYNDVKLLYIVGATEGNFPNVLTDTGLISDKEILSNSLKAKLEPTTKIINIRNRFKAVDVLLSAKEKCYISYHKVASNGKLEQPCEIISELNFLFNKKEINIESLSFLDNNININSLCFNNLDIYNANLNLKTDNNEDYISTIIKNALIKCNSLKLKPILNNVNLDYETLFFKNKKTSISLIEKYNTCPKLAFLSSGLGIKPNKKDKIEANVIGSFIHEVAEIFIKENKKQLGKLSEEEVKDYINICCQNLKTNSNYYSLYLDKNKFLLNLVKEECLRFCIFLNYEQTISNFKPIYTEKYFGDNASFKPFIIKVDDIEYKITGIVDRIDFCEDFFRIIDYKSGNSNFKNLKDGLFYGTKLQLFIYAQAIKQNVNKQFFGAFYLPIKNSFSKGNINTYKYSGFILDNVSLVQKCDSSFNEETRQSTIFDFKLNKPNKNGELVFRKNDNILSAVEIEFLNKYAKKIISNTIKNIKDGYIQTSPTEDACKICTYKNICKDTNNKVITRAQNYALTNSSFLEINYD